jgi:hypothetical protein
MAVTSGAGLETLYQPGGAQLSKYRAYCRFNSKYTLSIDLSYKVRNGLGCHNISLSALYSFTALQPTCAAGLQNFTGRLGALSPVLFLFLTLPVQYRIRQRQALGRNGESGKPGKPAYHKPSHLICMRCKGRTVSIATGLQTDPGILLTARVKYRLSYQS